MKFPERVLRYAQKKCVELEDSGTQKQSVLGTSKLGSAGCEDDIAALTDGMLWHECL